MSLPTRDEAKKLLEEHVKDDYQRFHAQMVGAAMEGYANLYGEDADLWYLTGYLHDIDFEEHPHEHPGESLKWFKEWGYPDELIHAVEAHAYGYNNFETLPQTKLAAALMACDELCGLFYAYQKLNPLPFGEMKASSIKKRFKEKAFAAKVDRTVITRGVEALGITLDEHIEHMITFLGRVQ
jgi:predicted hydrolase (HD superfamily)